VRAEKPAPQKKRKADADGAPGGDTQQKPPKRRKAAATAHGDKPANKRAEKPTSKRTTKRVTKKSTPASLLLSSKPSVQTTPQATAAPTLALTAETSVQAECQTTASSALPPTEVSAPQTNTQAAAAAPALPESVDSANTATQTKPQPAVASGLIATNNAAVQAQSSSATTSPGVTSSNTLLGADAQANPSPVTSEKEPAAMKRTATKKTTKPPSRRVEGVRSSPIQATQSLPKESIAELSRPKFRRTSHSRFTQSPRITSHPIYGIRQQDTPVPRERGQSQQRSHPMSRDSSYQSVAAGSGKRPQSRQPSHQVSFGTSQQSSHPPSRRDSHGSVRESPVLPTHQGNTPKESAIPPKPPVPIAIPDSSVAPCQRPVENLLPPRPKFLGLPSQEVLPRDRSLSPSKAMERQISSAGLPTTTGAALNPSSHILPPAYQHQRPHSSPQNAPVRSSPMGDSHSVSGRNAYSSPAGPHSKPLRHPLPPRPPVQDPVKAASSGLSYTACPVPTRANTYAPHPSPGMGSYHPPQYYPNAAPSPYTPAAHVMSSPMTHLSQSPAYPPAYLPAYPGAPVHSMASQPGWSLGAPYHPASSPYSQTHSSPPVQLPVVPSHAKGTAKMTPWRQDRLEEQLRQQAQGAAGTQVPQGYNHGYTHSHPYPPAPVLHGLPLM